MPPEPVVWPLDGHTSAKHTILRVYLEAWIPIMASRNDRLVLVDAFAGPGVYEGGEHGSPIVMLNAYLNHSQRERIKSDLVYLFIEADVRRVERLREEVGRLGKLPSNVSVQIGHGQYEDVFGAILDDLERRGAKLAPTFAFLDPFGYSQAPMSLSGKFLQFARCEVLVYVPLRFVNRFVGMDEQKGALNALYGGDRWKEALELGGAERIRALHDLFHDALVEDGGLKYVRAFEIISRKGSTGYHLFFGSNHELGLERMKEAMWRADPVDGQRFRDTTDVDALVLFEPEPNLDSLRDGLLEHFGGRIFTIEEVQAFTLATPFLQTHIKTKTLAPLERAGKLEAVDPPPKRRACTYPERTRLRFIP